METDNNFPKDMLLNCIFLKRKFHCWGNTHDIPCINSQFSLVIAEVSYSQTGFRYKVSWSHAQYFYTLTQELLCVYIYIYIQNTHIYTYIYIQTTNTIFFALSSAIRLAMCLQYYGQCESLVM